MIFSEEQQRVIDHIQKGGSCALLGKAGTGKSEVLRAALTGLPNVAICASTASAATNLDMGATTMHSLFGLKPVMYSPPEYGKKLGSFTKDVLKAIDTLVIEEVGMVRRDVFEMADHYLRKAKGNNIPWGGIQVVFVGDFGQIPPVLTKNEKAAYNHFYDSVWCFTSESFKWVDVFMLTKNYRQGVVRQQNILKSIRNCDENVAAAIDVLNKEARKYDQTDTSIPTICAYNKDADAINDYTFKRNTNPVVAFFSQDEGDPKHYKNFPVGDVLELKLGSLVKICANDNETGEYHNGMVGEIVHLMPNQPVGVEVTSKDGEKRTVFVTPFTWTVIDYKLGTFGLSKHEVASRTQLPLKLAYAMTVHSCQGMTMDKVNINLGWRTFAQNLAYVAISRVRDTTDIAFVRPLRKDDILVDKEVVEFYDKYEV